MSTAEDGESRVSPFCHTAVGVNQWYLMFLSDGRACQRLRPLGLYGIYLVTFELSHSNHLPLTPNAPLRKFLGHLRALSPTVYFGDQDSGGLCCQSQLRSKRPLRTFGSSEKGYHYPNTSYIWTTVQRI